MVKLGLVKCGGDNPLLRIQFHLSLFLTSGLPLTLTRPARAERRKEKMVKEHRQRLGVSRHFELAPPLKIQTYRQNPVPVKGWDARRHRYPDTPA
jgi:hypothetical protein